MSGPLVSGPAPGAGTDGSWAGRQAAFVDAAVWFADVAAGVGERWEQPALGEWSVRDLVGHTSRALLTVEAYARPAGLRVDLDSPVEMCKCSSH